jgi:hypothetical protein
MPSRGAGPHVTPREAKPFTRVNRVRQPFTRFDSWRGSQFRDQMSEVRRRSNFRCAAIHRLWYGQADAISNAIEYAKFYSRLQDAMIRFYDEKGSVIQAHEQAGDFREF